MVEELFTEEQLVIRWPDVTGAEMYSFSLAYRRNISEADGIGGLETSTNNNVTLTNLATGVNYVFEVCSINDAGSSCATLDVNGCEKMN